MIYGNTIIHFSELFRDVEYFTQKPKIGAGYTDKSEVKTTRLILQSDTGIEIKGTSGRLSGRNNWKIYDKSDTEIIWIKEDSPLAIGYYLIHPDNHEVYAIIKDTGWSHEGGFRSLVIERVQGNNNGVNEELKISTGVY